MFIALYVAKAFSLDLRHDYPLSPTLLHLSIVRSKHIYTLELKNLDFYPVATCIPPCFTGASDAPPSDSSNVATIGSSYVPPSTVSASTPPAMSLEPSGANLHLAETGSVVSRRDSLTEMVASNGSALREWERRHEIQLEEKRKAEESFAEEKRTEAQKQLADWYKEREMRFEKIRQKNRSNEAQEAQLRQRGEPLELPSNSQESWVRVCELIDFSADRAPSNEGWSSSRLAFQRESKASSSKLKCKGVQGVTLNSPDSSQSKQEPLATARDMSRMQQLLLQLKSANSSPNRLLNGISTSH